MQQEALVCPASGDGFRLALSSAPIASPDQHGSLINGRDYLGLYSSPIFSLSPEADKASPLSMSLTASSGTTIDDEDYAIATANRLILARLTEQYQEIANRYALCLNHFEDAAEEAETLRRENERLRLANVELNKRLGPVSGVKQIRRESPPLASIADDLRRLRIGDDLTPPQTSPRSVLGVQENRSADRIPLPKSISIRSSGYLKMNPGGAGPAASTRNSRLRVSSPRLVGLQQRVYMESEVAAAAAAAAAARDQALEFDVYNQGMFKTELCNKWEEIGECPYGEHCQFAHGIAELRPVIRHPRYKTEICRMILSGEACPYGHRCHFRHALSPDELSLLRSF